MHPQDREDGPVTCRRFTHQRVLNLAIVPPVRIVAVETVLLKATAGLLQSSEVSLQGSRQRLRVRARK